jgi:hypothetical protein
VPPLGEPELGAGQLAVGSVRCGRCGQRPRQRGPVDLARGPGRQRVHHGEQRHQRRRERVTQPIECRGLIELAHRHDIADEQLVAGLGGAHGGRGAGHLGQRLQGGVDLAKLDPAPAQLDLLVGPADEHQPVRLGPHQVAAAVGPRPAERGQRPVFLGVLLDIEVAGQAHPADHQLAGLAHRHQVAERVNHGQLPAVERQADAHRVGAGQPRRAGDHGGLGRAVGVPHLTPVHRDALGQLGRASLATEDQQPDVVERVDRPQRGEGRHGGDHGDLALDQPRAEVDAGPHECARRRDQAGPVPPGQPHLLAGGVEGHRQAGEHPVSRPDRLLGEEQPCLGVDEGRGAAVGDGDPLGPAGRARGEDDPRVVVGTGPGAGPGRPAAQRHRAASADHRAHAGLAEDQLGSLVGVLGVDRHVGRAGGEHAEDRQVEVDRAGRHAHPHPVADPDAGRRQRAAEPLDLGDQRLVAQHGGAVIDRVGMRMPPCGLGEDVQQRARRRGRPGGEDRGVRDERGCQDG